MITFILVKKVVPVVEVKFKVMSKVVVPMVLEQLFFYI